MRAECAHQRIEEQIDLIERLREDGHDPRLAELLLVTLLDVKLKFTRHLDALEGKPQIAKFRATACPRHDDSSGEVELFDKRHHADDDGNAVVTPRRLNRTGQVIGVVFDGDQQIAGGDTPWPDRIDRLIDQSDQDVIVGGQNRFR